MRCPKCGYISFDRQNSCSKCNHDLTAVSEQLKGTVVKAAAPFFLGSVLGEQRPHVNAPEPALFEEDETTLDLDELEPELPAEDEEELEAAREPLDDDDQPLPSLGFENIDVSDLMPPQEEEEEPVLNLESEPEESPPPPVQEEDDSLTGIEFPGFDSTNALSVDEQESTLDELEEEATGPSDDEEKDAVIDLSSLMNFDEPTVNPEEREDEHDTLELSLDDDENDAVLADEPKKPESAEADIPDFGLTLENDDK